MPGTDIGYANMNYWLHRITGGENALLFSEPLLFNHSYLSIGWSDFSEDDFVRDVKEGGIDALDSRFQEKPRSRYSLLRFVQSMRKGDIVLVPASGLFHLFEIADDEVLSNESIDVSLLVDWEGKQAKLDEKGYLHNSEGEIVDLGFYRKVIPLQLNIPRESYADQDLYYRMKMRQTNADISDLQKSIESAREAFEIKKPINLKEKITEVIVPNILDSIRQHTNDSKFEELVGWYMETLGAKVETPSKNESLTEEGDADKVAYFDNIKTAIMIQIKKHEGTTDDWAVEQIKAFKRNHNYGDYHTQMWVISTCDEFSREAKRLAEENEVRLISGLDFAKMILDAGLAGLYL